MEQLVWKSFWEQVNNKKNIYKLDRSTFFHYVVLEFLGYSPNSKLSNEEQKNIRNLEKESLEYDDLYRIYIKRKKGYNK